MKKMLKNLIKRAFIFFIAISTIVVKPCFNSRFISKTYAATVKSLLVKATKVNVRTGPSVNYKTLGSVNLGYRFSSIDYVKDSSGDSKYWYKFIYNGHNAYIRADFCKESKPYVMDAAFEQNLNLLGFPESYKDGLRQLHADFPSWTFILQNTGLDFNNAVMNEMVGTRNLVTVGAISSYKSIDEGKYDFTTSKWPTFDGNDWVCASVDILRYYMDPRNFLYDPYVFQYEKQTFNSEIHTLEGVKEMVKGTFLDDKVETQGLSFANVQNVIPGSTEIPTPINSSEGSSIIMPGIGGPITSGNDTTNINGANVIIPIVYNRGNEITAFTNTYIVPGGPGSGTSGIIVTAPFGPGENVYNNSNKNSGSNIIYSTGDSNNTYTASSYNYTYLPAGTYTYAELIFDACKQVGANPYVIVAMILQEQGKSGSDSVSGKNAKFPGVYNYGNVNSFAGDGLTAIENGLKYASTEGTYNRPWNTKEKGIYGLCDFYANSYVNLGQDTFYLKKFNVQGSNMFKHQYMTNVAGAASEGQILFDAYDEKVLNMPHEFKIPYYDNLPEKNCEIPTKDGSPNNRLKSITANGYTLTPTFDKDILNYSLIVDENVNKVKIIAEAFDKKASIAGTGNINVSTSITIAEINVVAENGDLRTYTVTIYKKGAENVQVQQVTSDTIPIIIGSDNYYSYEGPPTNSYSEGNVIQHGLQSSNIIYSSQIVIAPGNTSGGPGE